MVCRVVERALAARNIARAIVATDDQRIVEAVRSAGFEAALTRCEHRSGTDRLAEVAASLQGFEVIVNVQGDEPLISSATIDRAIEALFEEDKLAQRSEAATENSNARVGIVTTWEPIESVSDVLNPDIVKIVLDRNGRAIYFSRWPVPYPREAVRRHGTIEAALTNESSLPSQFRKHTGLYVYRRQVLLEFATWPESELERAESLEQLRALEHGVKIKAIQASAPSIGVDTMADLERVRAIVSEEKLERGVRTVETGPADSAAQN
jgi:3-deoxy-manno-octulosonate cytidylyltransferase (CMP-KDO synthetase)